MNTMNQKPLARFELPEKIKTSWVQALRSGEYKQGKFFLFTQTTVDGEKFCCLGVLCLIAGADKESLRLNCHPHSVGMFDSETFDVFYKGKYVTLPELNDGYKLTFNQIADIVEEQVPSY